MIIFCLCVLLQFYKSSELIQPQQMLRMLNSKYDGDDDDEEDPQPRVVGQMNLLM